MSSLPSYERNSLPFHLASSPASAAAVAEIQIGEPALHYAELTLREARAGRSGEALQAHTQWVAFLDLATWPAALAANVDPCTVVRIRFPGPGLGPPKAAAIRVLRGPASD